MKRILALLIFAFFTFGCTTPAPKTVYVVVTATQVPATTTPVFTATSIPTVIATATVAPKQIETITFKTTDNRELTMPMFTGDKATEEALDYISKNAKWSTGDIVSASMWIASRENAKLGSKLLKIEGFVKGSRIVGPRMAPLDGSTYITYEADTLGDGTDFLFVAKDGHIQIVYIAGVDIFSFVNSFNSELPPPSN